MMGSQDTSKKDELRRDRESLPKLIVDRNMDPAAQMDRFESWLSAASTAIATWSTEAERYWYEVVSGAKNAYAMWSQLTPMERALRGGTASRMLGLTVPVEVPLLEKVLRAELQKVLPEHVKKEIILRRISMTIDMVSFTMQTLLPSESHVRVHTLDALERELKPVRTFREANDQLRQWNYKYRVAQETFHVTPEPYRAYMAVKSMLNSLISSNFEFGMDWTNIVRELGMREGATTRKVELLVTRLEVELTQRAMEEGVRKDAPQDRKTGVANFAGGTEHYDMSVDDSPETYYEYAEANLFKGGKKGKDGPGKGASGKGKDGKGHGKGKQQPGPQAPGGTGKQPDGPAGKAKGKGKQVPKTCQSYMNGCCKKGNFCKEYHPRMPDRCFVCGSKDHRSSDCPYKKKPVNAKTADAGEDGETPTSRHMAAAVSVSYAGAMADAMELDEKFYLFDSGATHVLLPMKMLEGNDKKRAAKIRLRLAAGRDTVGLVVDGEIYASGVSRCLLPAGRICKLLGVTFVWDDLGPRLTARGELRWLPVIWMQVRGGIPCVSHGDGNVVRRLLRDRDRRGPAMYSEWKELLQLPEENELELREVPPPGLVDVDSESDSSSQRDDEAADLNYAEAEFDEAKRLVEEMCGGLPDLDTIEEKHFEMKEHIENNHYPKRKDCKVCQEADGPVHVHRKTPVDEKGLHVLHADLSGPHHVAQNANGNDVAYGLIAVLRIQSADLSSTVLLPWVRTMATKNQIETFDNTQQIIAEIEGASLGGIEFGKRVKRFHTDKGKEWDNQVFKQGMKEMNIPHTFTQGYSPQSNGTAERYVGLLKTVARRMLIGGKLPEEYWPWALEHAALMLRMKTLSKMSKMLPFGAHVVAKKFPPERGTWNRRGFEGRLLKFNPDNQEAWLLDSEGNIIRGGVPMLIVTTGPSQTSPDAGRIGRWQRYFTPAGREFWVHSKKGWTQWSRPIEMIGADAAGPEHSAKPPGAKEEPKQEPVVKEEQAALDEPVPEVAENPDQEPKSEPVESDREGPEDDSEESELEDDGRLFQANATLEVRKPVTIDAQAVAKSTGEEKRLWIESIQSELRSLELTQTMRKATQSEKERYRSEGAPIAPSKMVFVLKPGKEVNTVKHKSRLVVCGNFLPQIAMTSTQNLDVTAMRMLIAWSVEHNMRIGTVDVKTAFLNADIKGWERVLIAPPSVLVKMNIMQPGECWIAEKALYGLKESPKAWEETRDKVMSEMTMTIDGQDVWLVQSVTHSSIWLIVTTPQEEDAAETDMWHPLYGYLPFLAKGKAKVIGGIGVYVDDLLTVGPLSVIKAVLAKVKSIWDTSEPEILGENGCTKTTYLGVTIEIDQESWENVTKLYLHQTGYSHMVIDKFEQQRPLTTKDTPGTPVHAGHDMKVERTDNDDVNVKYCQQALGSLLWLVTRTRPDLTWAYSVAASMTTRNPKEAANRVRHMLGYLKNTIELGFVYSRNDEGLCAIDVHADASFAPGGGASHGGSIAYVHGNPVAWKSHRQTVVSASTAESELIEAADAHLHARTIMLMLAELDQQTSLIHLRCDNSAALSMVGEASSKAWRSRHISIRGHILDEAIREGEVQFSYVGTKEQKADGMTKGLSRELHNTSLQMWRMVMSP